jgi:hypothetical protein
MKTMNIFKTLALAMLMPTMLLTTACSSEDDVANTSNITSKGYALPVTVNVTRQDGATRATYNESTRKLEFSTGDKLFVRAMGSPAGKFAGTLEYDSETGKFSGTIMTQNEYSGTAEALLAATSPSAALLPAGYNSYSYLTIEDEGTYGAYLDTHIGKAFALTKAAAVEQFSLESASSYSSGFALSPQNAIVSFTISGLAANTAVAVLFKDNYDFSATPVNVTTDATGVATFAVGMYDYANFDNYSLTVDGNAIALPADKLVEAGKIYNMSRSAAPATDLSTLSDDYVAQNGEILTGTLGSHVKISIADGATVTLKDVNITNLGDNFDWPGITCLGDATLVLEGTNEVCPGIDDTGEFSNYPAIYIAPGYTLTIQGAGTLTAYSNAYEPYGAGIGGGYDIPCGHIVINSGNIKAQGGYYAAGIGSGGYGGYCGDITINGGTIMATGGDCAAGIGSGRESGYCGTITIKSTVTSVTATKGDGSPNSIGAGQDSPAITVNIEAGANVTQN